MAECSLHVPTLWIEWYLRRTIILVPTARGKKPPLKAMVSAFGAPALFSAVLTVVHFVSRKYTRGWTILAVAVAFQMLVEFAGMTCGPAPTDVPNVVKAFPVDFDLLRQAESQ